jgi:hypothetical protein
MADCFSWIAVIAGIIVGGLALTAIFARLDVSTGHAITISIAAILIALPLVSTFEWTGDGVKLATKDIATKLTTEVEDLRNQQAGLLKSLESMNAEMNKMGDQIVAIQIALKSTPDVKPLPEYGGFGQFEDLNTHFTKAIQENDDAIKRLGTLKDQINGITPMYLKSQPGPEPSTVR